MLPKRERETETERQRQSQKDRQTDRVQNTKLIFNAQSTA